MAETSPAMSMASGPGAGAVTAPLAAPTGPLRFLLGRPREMAGRWLASLHTRLLVLVLLALLPPLGLVFLAAREDRQLATAHAQGEALRVARFAALQHSQLVTGAHQLLIGLAQLPAVRSLDGRTCAAIFADLLGKFPSYGNIAAVNVNGDIFCSAVPPPRPVNIADRPHFKRVLETRRFVASGYLTARTTGKPGMVFAYPVVDQTDTVRVVLNILLDLDWLSRLAEQALLPPGSALSVIDQDGTILGSYPQLSNWMGKSVPEKPILRAVLARKDEGTVESEGTDGVRRLYGFTRLPISQEAGAVYVSVGIPTAVAFAEAERAQTRSLVGLGLVGVVVLAGTWVVGNLTILRRVRRVMSTVGRLGAGDLSARTGLASAPQSDEIGQLASVFDEMAASLERRTAESHRAEEALRASEARFRSVAQSAVDAIVVAGADGTILSVNPAALAMFGVSEDEMLGQPLTRLMPERYHEAHRSGIARLRDTGRTRVMGKVLELHGLRKDGSEFPCELALATWATAGERFFSGMIRDVTERQRAESTRAMGLAVAQILAEATTLDAATPHLLEAIGVATDWGLTEMWMMDPDGTVLRRAGAWHRPGLEVGAFLGASRDTTHSPGADLPGRAWASGEPVWEEDLLAGPPSIPEPMAASAGLRGALAVPMHGVAPVGVLVCFSQAPRAPDGRLLAALQDAAARIGHFAERKQAEEVLQRSEAHVLQLQRLESVGRLAGGVAHDFNNLLTVILGRSQLLLARSQMDDRAREDVTLVAATAQRAAALTRQLLAFSRKQILEPRVLDLNDLVAGLMKMLRRLIGEDIELAFLPGPDLGRVNADPGQLEQVIVNLVVNARDAMPQGGRLALGTENVELDESYAREHVGARPGLYVMLAVSDTGIGMDAETQARVFEPFFTTKEAGKGTGLGLSTVYGIVKQSGGHIFLSSALGRGTTFNIYLPRVEAAVATGEQVVAAPPRGSETVLLVEDDGGVRELTRAILERQGYTLLVASLPDEALRIAEQHAGPIHLVLSDVVMPHMSGPQMVEALAPRLRGSKVLYMSGYTAEAIGQHGVLQPGIALIHKPFSAEDLANRVRQVLDVPPPAETAALSPPA